MGDMRDVDVENAIDRFFGNAQQIDQPGEPRVEIAIVQHDLLFRNVMEIRAQKDGKDRTVLICELSQGECVAFEVQQVLQKAVRGIDERPFLHVFDLLLYEDSQILIIGQQLIKQDIQEESGVDLCVLRVQRATRQHALGKWQRDLVGREQKIASYEEVDLMRLHTIGMALQGKAMSLSQRNDR